MEKSWRLPEGSLETLSDDEYWKLVKDEYALVVEYMNGDRASLSHFYVEGAHKNSKLAQMKYEADLVTSFTRNDRETLEGKWRLPDGSLAGFSDEEFWNLFKEENALAFEVRNGDKATLRHFYVKGAHKKSKLAQMKYESDRDSGVIARMKELREFSCNLPLGSVQRLTDEEFSNFSCAPPEPHRVLESLLVRGHCLIFCMLGHEVLDRFAPMAGIALWERINRPLELGRLLGTL